MKRRSTPWQWWFIVAAVACGDAAGSGGPYRTVIETVGDTIVARTTGDVPPEYLRKLTVEWSAGGAQADSAASLGDVFGMAVAPDGRVFVWDPQTPSIWLVSADGQSMKRVGGQGAGPGEYDRVNGITVRPDGKLIAWDGGNARLNVYDADGIPVTSWKVHFGGRITSNALTSDAMNRVWMRSSVRAVDSPPGQSSPAVFRWDSTGSVVDTVLVPVYAGSDAFLTARRQDPQGTSTSQMTLPYGRVSTYGVSPFGALISGPGTPYLVYTELDGKPLRIERDYVPIQAPAEERQQRRALIEFNLRQTQPNWVWDGPDIPTAKPPYVTLTGGLDGRIWVQLYTESEPYEPDPPSATQTNPTPLVKFRPKDRRWDVFESDGRYIGRVVAPIAFTPYAMRANTMWGVLRDQDDVPSVVKMRIEPPLEATSAR